MPVVYTIGVQRKPLSAFITLLRQAGVDAVIDIRLRNTSQLAGYSKRDDLAFLLREGFDIAYEHRPDLEFVCQTTGLSPQLVQQYVQLIKLHQKNA